MGSMDLGATGSHQGISISSVSLQLKVPLWTPPGARRRAIAPPVRPAGERRKFTKQGYQPAPSPRRRGKKKFHRTFAWIGYSAVASGLIIFLISLSGYISKFYDSLIIGIPYLKNFIVAIIKGYLKNLCINSLFFIIFGIIFIIVYFVHYTKKLKKPC